MGAIVGRQVPLGKVRAQHDVPHRPKAEPGLVTGLGELFDGLVPTRQGLGMQGRIAAGFDQEFLGIGVVRLSGQHRLPGGHDGFPVPLDPVGPAELPAAVDPLGRNLQATSQGGLGGDAVLGLQGGYSGLEVLLWTGVNQAGEQEWDHDCATFRPASPGWPAIIPSARVVLTVSQGGPTG